MSRAKPQRWVEAYPCQSGHFHVIWNRNGKYEHVTISLEKLTNMLLDHAEIVDISMTIAIGLIEARGISPRIHPKDLN